MLHKVSRRWFWNLLDPKNVYHFIGIGGVGMSALAFLLLEMGFKVSGSDIGESVFIDRLIRKGVRVFRRHDPSNLKGVSCVVYSSAITEENPELREALRRGLKVMHRADLLGLLMEPYKGIGITGTHGKTTTSAMAVKILSDAGLDPVGVVGGDYPYIGGNYRWGRGKIFVAEIDESDGSFLRLSKLHCLLITNLEEEHMEHYVDFNDLKGKIRRLADIANVVVFNADDPVLRNMGLKGLSYGFNYGMIRGEVLDCSSLYIEGYGNLSLKVAGKHNLYNALSIIALGRALGLDLSAVARSLEGFTGVRRRMEVIGKARGITFMDDYAHHPTEIRAVLETLRLTRRERRIVVLFQPHRYSRTARMYADIASSLELADWIGITEIYSAAELPINGVSGKLIYEVLLQKGKSPSFFFKTFAEAKEALKNELREGDLFLTMGAGDVYKLGETLFAEFKEGCS